MSPHERETEASSLLTNRIVAFGPSSEDEPAVLLRHDSDFSVGSSYHDGSPNDLAVWQGATLLTAECLGTGLLALPGGIQVLGFWPGILFLIINIPINLAAGTLLSASASFVEDRQKMEDRLFQAALNADTWDPDAAQQDYRALNELTAESAFTVDTAAGNTVHTHLHHDTATYDFIGMTTALFRNNKRAVRQVQAMYYANLFLVLGNYILVMSHAVVAASGETLCLPTAGVLASAGMFVVAQLRTMARLGRTASIVSLLALLVVVIQCLVAARSSYHNPPAPPDEQAQNTTIAINSAAATDQSTTSLSSQASFLLATTALLKQFSALGSIGFAVGSQKLLLNIRHELQDRKQAPRTLFYGLMAFGSVYVFIIVLAGPNPPSFLFDAIPPGTWNRRIAGILLWGHVMVSYAINSQAICASLERLVSPRISWLDSQTPPIRWLLLTGFLAVLAYTVANAIPFFDDLVALIGAMTSVPLTLLLPALFWRKQGHYPLWTPTWDSLPSWSLLVYATLFMVTASVGSLWSIRQDWAFHGAPFSCR
eukprot:scaffold13793_cov165-Amphora_coffeaeformis.AAC.4